MNEICGDNRFEIIAKAKAHLLDATNIDTSEDEMKVLDGFLLRCWQMGWLDRYDRKTENSSEKPNNCEDEPPTTDYCDVCNHKGCDNCVADGSNPYCVPSHYEPKDEPTISKMEQVDKDINVRSKDEPQTDMAEDIVRSYGFKAESYQQAKAKDEPQTDCAWK